MPRPTRTPYRPGFSQRPPTLAGRDDVLDAADESFAVVAEDGRASTPMLLVGARGVGKTVLLDEIGARAGARYGWPRIAVELTGEPFAPQLVAAARDTVTLLTQTTASQRMRLTDATVRAGGVGLSAELRFSRREPGPRSDPAPAIEDVLAELAGEAQRRDTGVVITIDELQQADRFEIAAFGAMLQRAMREDWPLFVVGAGLNSMRAPGKLPTYFERADWHEIGLLDENATLAALLDPAQRAGRPFEHAAGLDLARRTGGYPFAIQLFGNETWRASAGSPAITADHVQSAVVSAEAKLARGLYATRWAQASPQEREYLLAAAVEQRRTGRITGGTVAARLQMTAQRASPIRARLISKGILSALGRDLQFVIPGMADYVMRVGAETGRSGS